MATKNYGAITDPDKLGAFVERLLAAGKPFGFDIETGYDGNDRAGGSLHPDNPDTKIVGISFTNSVEWARYVPVAHDLSVNMDQEAAARWFWKLLQSGLGIAHNAKFELRHLSRWFREQLSDDPEVGAAVRAVRGYFPVYSDTMLEAYLEASQQSFGLKALVKALFHHDQAEIMSLFPNAKKGAQKKIRFNTLEVTPEVVAYACEDSAWCLALHEHFHPLVKDRMLYKVEMEILPILCEMEDYGVRYDWARMEAAAEEARRFCTKIQAEIESDLTAAIRAIEGADTPAITINLNAPAQVAKALYERMGLKPAVFTDTGAPSTNAIALEAHSRTHPVVRKILDYKEMTKLAGTYLEKYKREYDYALDGMTHPNHMQALVPSGRFAVSDPPYQQSPKKYHYELADGTTFDLNFRELIVAPAEHYILGYDYSQIELRMLAGEAQEPTLLAAFDNDEDVHTATAALMLGKARADVTKDERAIGKTMNFALLYGMGVKSLADRLALTKDTAQKLYDQYFASYSAVSLWVDRQKALGIQRGYATTKFGRRVTIWELQSPEAWIRGKGERLCINSPIQGAAADYMKISMVRGMRAIQEAGLSDRVHLVMNIHDALEFYVHESVDPQTVIDVLSPAVVYSVAGLPKIVADWHVGQTWGSVTDLKLDAAGQIIKEAPAVEREEDPEIGEDGEVSFPEWNDADIAHLTGQGPLPGADAATPEVRVALEEATGTTPTPHVPSSWDRIEQIDRNQPHGFETLMELEGRCLICGLSSDSALHRATPAPSAPAGAPEPVQPAQEPPVVQADDLGAAELEELEHKTLVVTITEMPDSEQFRRFGELARGTAGPNILQLSTPEGDLVYEGWTTGLTPEHQPQISLALGGATAKWAPSSVDGEALLAGLSF